MIDRPEFDPADTVGLLPEPYPHLSDEMVARIGSYGTLESIDEGHLLYARGQRSVDFYVLISGTVTVFDIDARGRERQVVVHEAGSFTGELDLFDDRGILLNGRAGRHTSAYRLPRSAFRRMVSCEPDIGEFLTRCIILRRFGLVRRGFGGVMLIGHDTCVDTARIRRFLSRNGYPYRLLDSIDDPCALELIERQALRRSDLPAVFMGDGTVMVNPTTPVLADALGFSAPGEPGHVYDLAVVGAGPAGLAAGVYGASEGLDTVVIEGLAPGGQAATSSKIENYLGFPSGVSGHALASRAQVQALKFGARLTISRTVTRLRKLECHFELDLDDGTSVSARSVVAATGARYRKLGLGDFDRFDGRGIHYAATAIEGSSCSGSEVVVVGGGNSAGQAAVYLSRVAAHVHIIVRGEGLAATMSDYLVQRIGGSPRITLHVQSEVVSLEGAERLERVIWRNVQTGEVTTAHADSLFVMIGASPNTGWLEDALRLDPKGFIPTGDQVLSHRAGPFGTELRGLFAVGDVRSGSVKRVASSVGEGSVVVQAIHQFLRPELAC
ncbi:FAD-dependent oxidoreductase [Luteibacter aegosomatissinici]|uniref:FAD-dependent oxidoreductase n=1 Tax=Luteibacter aegosomatissinici TaxID=2911539 RepID=UPI001FF9F0E0|nr:FAD-dependent oxidoreductase [Luteibacter aegosomatissinici]UPG92730.1 FAD-dependent oxidoreductase [Luteibacter aegosomatissinici]